MSDSAETPIRVLLVEDEPQQAELIRQILSEIKSPRFEVQMVGCLRDAAHELLNRTDIDVTLLDLSLPDGKGLQTFNVVSTAAPDVPVVILTGLNDETVGLEAVKHGAQEFLVKGEVDVRTIS